MNTHRHEGEGGVASDQPGDDWGALAADWREQPAMGVDVEQLRRQVVQGGCRLRWWLAMELLTTAAAVALCLWAALQAPPVLPPTVMAITIVGLLGFQGWALWIRRRQIRDGGLDVRALLALQRRRIDTSLHYWRVNIWVTVALWVGLYGLWRFGLATPVSNDIAWGPQELTAAVLVNAPVAFGFAVFAWWRCTRARRRRRTLRALQAEFDAD